MAFAVIMEHTGDSARHGVAMNGLWWLQCTLFWPLQPLVSFMASGGWPDWLSKMHGELLALDGFSWCRPW